MAGELTLSPVLSDALVILGSAGIVIPLFARPRPRGTVNKLVAPLSAWDNDTAFLGYWSRDT